MKIFRFNLLLLAILISVPRLAASQSHWLHQQLFTGNAGRFVLSASDSSSYVIAPNGFPSERTTDYGTTWHSIFDTLPRIQLSVPCMIYPSRNLILLGCDSERMITTQNANSTSVRFVDAGHILRSTDAGVTWRDTAIGSMDTSMPQNSIGAIAALDSDHLFLPIASDHYLISSDGGATWGPISSPTSNHFFMGRSLPNPIAIYPAPNTLIVSEVDISDQYYYYSAKIFRSTDLGKTWNAGFQFNYSITKMAFVTPSLGYASGYVIDTNGNRTTALIDKTTNGGVTWTTIYTNPFDGNTRLNSIAFADSLNGLAVGDRGTIIRTTDGGASWQTMQTDFSRDDQGANILGDVAYPDVRHAVVASGTGEVLVYHPDTLLDLPVITYPEYGQSVRPNFTPTWLPVPGATAYELRINPGRLSVSQVDTVVSGLSCKVNLDPNAQYSIFVKALSGDKTGNWAHQPFYTASSASVSATSGGGAAARVRTYPNPASGVVHCELTNLTSPEFSIELVDIFGRNVRDLTALTRRAQLGDTAHLDLELEDLPSGTYAIRFSQSGQETQSMFVILH